MAAIGAVVSFYRSSAVIKRFRISFRDELKSLTMFKPDLENFLGLKDKARELGVNSFELKLFRLTKLTGQMTAKIMPFILKNGGIRRGHYSWKVLGVN